MNDFDYDALQKKRIARGAYYKKNGSKSKGCTLPSDYLTDAQKRKMNGVVKVVKLDQPRSLNEFRNLSKEDRLAYLDFLKENYRPSYRMLATMFGCSQPTAMKEMEKIGYSTGYQKHEMTTKNARKKWEDFLSGVKSQTEETPDFCEQKNQDEKPDSFGVMTADICVVGTPKEIMQMLLLMCGDNRRKFRLSFGEVEE